MAPQFDPYQTLQVTPEADPDVIQAAYRVLARKHHPDMGGSEEQMARINEAWALLRDEERRGRYDRERAAADARVVRQAFAADPPREVRVKPAPVPPVVTGTVLDFGRYAGHSLGELVRTDPEYLEWLARTPIGLRLRQEIYVLLASAKLPQRVAAQPQRGFFHR